MTNEQKAWLDAHKDYQPIMTAGGHIRYRDRGLLNPDGFFTRMKRNDEAGGAAGSFEVGIREVVPPGQIQDPRGNPDQRGYDVQRKGEFKVV